MLQGNMQFDSGLSLRPMVASDNAFIENLYSSTREDLRLLDANDELINELIESQRHAQTQGYGEMFPNAMYFVAEHHAERIGRVVLDFGHNEVRVVDIALIPEARGKGFAGQILRSVQKVASKVMAPVALTVRFDHVQAKQLYARLGFVVDAVQIPYERMVWYPPTPGAAG